MTNDRTNLLNLPAAGGPAPTFLPEDHPDMAARAAFDGGATVVELVGQYPAASYLWAMLAEASLSEHRPEFDVAAYAYARTGYHRGLDALRKAGWRGAGPVPVEHVPNQGFLRSLLALQLAAEAIGDTEEAERCAEFLDSCDPSARAFLTA